MEASIRNDCIKLIGEDEFFTMFAPNMYTAISKGYERVKGLSDPRATYNAGVRDAIGIAADFLYAADEKLPALVREKVSTIEDDTTRFIIESRCCEGKTWDEISDLMGEGWNLTKCMLIFLKYVRNMEVTE